MTAPLIGLPTYGRDEKDRFTLFAEYVDSVRRAGGIAVLMPPGETRLKEWLDTIDGLILTGGGDLAPDAYGGRRLDSIYDLDPERDASEIELARLLTESDIPGLCICRGMQVLNVVLGGTLMEHLPDEVGESVAHRLPPREPVRHPVRLQEDSLVASVVGGCEINPFSWHHQAIRDIGSGLEAVGWASDGIVEAVEPTGRPQLLAVQWHPELSAADDPDQQRLFDALVEWAVERRTIGA